jgi:hypothetical protein
MHNKRMQSSDALLPVFARSGSVDCPRERVEAKISFYLERGHPLGMLPAQEDGLTPAWLFPDPHP